MRTPRGELIERLKETVVIAEACNELPAQGVLCLLISALMRGNDYEFFLSMEEWNIRQHEELLTITQKLI